MAQKFDINAESIRQLADILNETHLTELEWEAGSVRIRVARQATVSYAAPLPAPAAPQAAAPELTPPKAVSWAQHAGAINSPMVGTAYLSPEPGSAAFVKEGATVKEGQTLMIIEAMKVMNPLKSPRAGILQKILVNDSAPVEFGEALMIIE